MTIRPSSLPMLALCPRFQGDGGENADASAGTKRHRVLAQLLEESLKAGAERRKMILSQLDEEDDREAVLWAEEYVRVNAPMSDYPLEIEVTRQFTAPDFSTYQGTPDIVCGNHLFDFKWRERNYDEQLADYSRVVPFDEVHVHVLFGASKRARRLTITKEQAEAMVFPVIEAAMNSEAKPTINPYCGWCEHRLGCSAHRENVKTVALAREWDKSIDVRCLGWLGSGAHTSDLGDDAELAGSILRLARDLAKWCEAAEFHCREMAVKRGIVPSGFEVKATKGKSAVSDVPRAFAALALPQEEFIRACDLRMNTSKKYKDRAGIVDVFAAFNGLKRASAKRSVVEKLGDILKEGAGGVKLVSAGEPEDSSDE